MKKMYTPIITPYPANTYLRAFIIAGVTAALVAGIAIEVRLEIDKTEKSNKWPRPLSFFVTLCVAFIISLGVNCMSRYLFGTGGGMLAPHDGNLGRSFNNPY